MFLNAKITDKIIEATLWFIAFVNMSVSFISMSFGRSSLSMHQANTNNPDTDHIYLFSLSGYFLVSVVFYFFQDKIPAKILYSYVIVNIVIIALSIWFMQDL